jgi:hypothetical protein
LNLFNLTRNCADFAMAEPHFFGDADVTPLAAAALAGWLLIFLWRSWKLLRCDPGMGNRV